MSECVFCQIVAGEAPAEVVRRGLHSLVIRPLNPVVEGHVICLPYDHVNDAASYPRITMLTMGELAEYAEMQRSLGETQEFNIITSAVSYTHLTLPTIHVECRSRWSPYH